MHKTGWSFPRASDCPPTVFCLLNFPQGCIISHVVAVTTAKGSLGRTGLVERPGESPYKHHLSERQDQNLQISSESDVREQIGGIGLFSKLYYKM